MGELVTVAQRVHLVPPERLAVERYGAHGKGDQYEQTDRDKAQEYVTLMQKQGLLIEKVPEEPVAMELEDFFAKNK